MTPIEAVQTCLQKYAVFRGRASRPEFWWFTAVMIPGFIVVDNLVVHALMRIILDAGGISAAVFVLPPIAHLMVLLPWLAAGYRRLHDVDLPGWPVLVLAVMAVLSKPLYLMMWFAAGDAAMPSGIVGVLANVLAFAYMVVGWATLPALVIVAVLLARPGTQGPNRYGV